MRRPLTLTFGAVAMDRARSTRAEQHPNPRDELPHGERLGHVVVRTNAQPHQEIRLVVASREHQHGDRPLRLESPAHLVAVEAGKHHVQYHEVGIPRGSLLERGEPVVHLVDREVLGRQARGDGLGDGAFVLDDEDAGLVAHASRVGERGDGAAQKL